MSKETNTIPKYFGVHVHKQIQYDWNFTKHAISKAHQVVGSMIKICSWIASLFYH